MKINNLTILIIAGVFLISLVYALTGVTQTDIFYDGSTLEPVTNVQEILYTCANSACLTKGNLVHSLNSGSSNSVTFEYPYNPYSTASNRDYYSHFSFAECYLPKEYVEGIWGYGVNLEQDYHMQKATSCHSPIDSFSVTNKNYVNEPVVINMVAEFEADAHSAFTDLELPWFPVGYEDHYSVETKVTLNIYNGNDELIHTDYVDLDILMDTSENVQFEWTPTEEGNYTARINTDVTDCQCASSFEEYAEREFVIWSERPQNECYTIINDLEAVPEFGKAGEVTTISYNKISNYADNSHNKYPVKTNVIYQIIKNGVEVFIEANLLDANYNAETPTVHSFDWTPEEGGEYVIKVTGIAQSPYCEGKTNPEDVAILGYFVDAPEKYNVEFIIKDSKTKTALKNTNVQIGSQTGKTNSAGKVSFHVNPGNYDWLVSLAGYIPEGGNVYVNEDMTIEVLLDEIILMDDYEVQFIVKDSTTLNELEGAEVEIGPFNGLTNSDGEVSFNLLEGNYDWLVSLAGYIPEGGNVYVDENRVIEVFLDEIILMDDYEVQFRVRNCDCSGPISGAEVEIGPFSGLTDSEGEINFTLLEGAYDWLISKTGWESKSGSVYVDSNQVIEVCLDKEEDDEGYEVSFIVKECNTSKKIGNAVVKLSSNSKYTNWLGRTTFKNIPEGNHNWEISKTGYSSESGSIFVDGDINQNVCLNKIEEEDESVTEVEVLFPNGGETIRGYINILWEAVNNFNRSLLIDVYYSEDGGSTFVKIADDIENDGTLSWNTNNVQNGDKYLIKVCAYEGIKPEEVCDVSDAFFKVDNEEDDDKDRKRKSNSQISLQDELCTPLWNCKIVGECIDGFRQLDCVDLNACEFVYDKPDEKVACLEPQPVLIGEDEEGTSLLWLLILLGIAIVFLIILIILLR